MKTEAASSEPAAVGPRLGGGKGEAPVGLMWVAGLGAAGPAWSCVRVVGQGRGFGFGNRHVMREAGLLAGSLLLWVETGVQLLSQSGCVPACPARGRRCMCRPGLLWMLRLQVW